MSQKHRIIILGASGYIGYQLYKELAPYYKTFGTYFTPTKVWQQNKHFFHYDIENNDLYDVLEATKPTVIISALRGNFNAQIIAHKHATEYAIDNGTKIIFLSATNVFDAYSKYPSYEIDKTLSHSKFGYFKIKIENMLLRLPRQQVAILRLPMVFGINCPRIQEIKHLLSGDAPVEVFPNLIMNVALDRSLCQQVHYIINRALYGVFHLGSTDLIHHDEFIHTVLGDMSLKPIRTKKVYTTNDDRYLAVLPKYNALPQHLQITSNMVLKELTKQLK